jgi:hypothetical protein
MATITIKANHTIGLILSASVMAFSGCSGRCDGIGCNADDVEASLLFFLSPENTIPKRTPVEASFRIDGEDDQGSSWGIVVDESTDSTVLKISTGSSGEIHSVPFQIGKKDLNGYETHIDDSNTEFGRELYKHNLSLPYYIITAPKSSLSDLSQRSGSMFIYDDLLFEDNPRTSIYSSQNGDFFPAKISLCGDLDNDGIDDWIASKAHSGDEQIDLYRGEVVIGLSTVWYNSSQPLNITSFPSISGDDVGDGFGHSILCDHDLDGDNNIDVVVSSPFANSTVSSAGKVAVYTDINALDPIYWLGTTAHGWFGYSMAIGDLNGDGGIEVSVQSFSSKEGLVKIWPLEGTNIANQPIITLRSDQEEAFFGKRQIITDTNNDGIDDLIISAPFYNTDTSKEVGVVFIYTGTSDIKSWQDSSLSDELIKTITGNESYQRLGDRFWVKDLDGDLTKDVIVQILRP